MWWYEKTIAFWYFILSTESWLLLSSVAQLYYWRREDVDEKAEKNSKMSFQSRSGNLLLNVRSLWQKWWSTLAREHHRQTIKLGKLREWWWNYIFEIQPEENWKEKKKITTRNKTLSLGGNSFMSKNALLKLLSNSILFCSMVKLKIYPEKKLFRSWTFNSFHSLTQSR